MRNTVVEYGGKVVQENMRTGVKGKRGGEGGQDGAATRCNASIDEQAKRVCVGMDGENYVQQASIKGKQVLRREERTRYRRMGR